MDLFDSDGSEDVADTRPGPMFAAPDRYFDEPDREDRAGGLVRWAARATVEQRKGLLRFSQWMNEAGDGERRAIMVLIDRFQGRVPRGAVVEAARLACVDRKTVQRAIKRFTALFPGAISESRRVTERRASRDPG